MKKILWAVFALLVMNPVFAADTYTIGILAKRGAAGFYEKWLMHAYYLCDGQADLKIKVKPLTFDEVDGAVANKEVDFVMVNPSMYVTLESKYGVRAIATMINKDMFGRTASQFGGVIFTSADSSGISGLADVKGRAFLAVKETSLGGFQMAEVEFARQGIDLASSVSSMEFLGTHDAVVNAVIARPGTIGTVRSDTLERMMFESKVDTARIRVLNAKEYPDFPFMVSTSLYPEWPFATLKHVPESVVDSIAARLYSMPSTDTAATSASIGGWTHTVDYTPVRELMQTLGILGGE
jgi:ABC-type phosphate/phosphonate transport system substrate-binding protein